jgi:hypothetical protein
VESAIGGGTMRRLLPAMVGLLAGSAFVPLAVAAQTLAGAVDCTRLSDHASVVETEVCAAPDLQQVDHEIDELSARLEMTLTGMDKEALIDTERPFLRTRNACQNQAPPDSRARVRACVERVLLERRNMLTAALSSPTSVRNAVVQYAYIDGPFFRKYGDALVGGRVQIFGCMVLAPAPTWAARIHAAINDSSCTDSGGPSVTVLFKSMNESQAFFLDTKTPTAYWQGAVERRDGQLVLFVEDVLGMPLP